MTRNDASQPHTAEGYTEPESRLSSIPTHRYLFSLCVIFLLSQARSRLHLLTMKGYTLLLLLSSFLLACHGSNNTFSWANASLNSALSSRNAKIGDWVAAGLGLSTHETSSSDITPMDVDEHAGFISRSTAGVESESLVTTTSSNAQALMTELSSRNKTRPDTIAISNTAKAVVGTTLYSDPAANILNVTTTTNCWQSWVSY